MQLENNGPGAEITRFYNVLTMHMQEGLLTLLYIMQHNICHIKCMLTKGLPIALCGGGT